MHDRAVRLALTGSGLMPVDVLEHLEHCDACRQEIEALRALNAELKGAAPGLERSPEWEAGLVEKTLEARKPRPTGIRVLRWRAAAAGLILAAGFSGALSVLRLESPGQSVQASLSTTERQAVARGLDTFAYGTGDNSTAALLGLTEASVGKEAQEPSADDLEDYLNPVDTGGWNG